MVQSRRSRKKLLGSHQKSWVWGKHAVLEILEAGRWQIIELYLSEALSSDDLRSVQSLAEQNAVKVLLEPPERLYQLSHTKEHQGYLAKMGPFPYAGAADVLEELKQSEESPTVCVLDGIQDPHNLGAIIRSAEVLGIAALFMGEKGQVGVTSMVVRSSAGAANRVKIARVPELNRLVGQLKAADFRILAATEKASLDCSQSDMAGAAAIILGSEGSGVDEALLALCDEHICIPQQGRIGSLNVAAAAAIMFYEAARQRQIENA